MWTFYPSAFLYLCISVSVVFTNTEMKELELKEGEVCKEEDGVRWTCKKAESCQKAEKEGTGESACITGDNKSVVCCEPEDKIVSVGSMSKSRQMCEQYSQHVFVKQFQGFGDEGELVDSCAATEPLIVNGVNAEPKEFPHMALIGYKYKDSIEWSCGGSLISEKFVMSAAHCTKIPELGLAKMVRLGEYNILSTDDEYEAHSLVTDYEIVERINHPEYKSPFVYNDIALYRLGEEVVFNEFIRPACLHTEYVVDKLYGVATGWGLTKPQGSRSDVLQKVNLTLTSAVECINKYKNRRKKTMPGGIKDESMICAGDLPSGKDTCNGDSGGPLQLRLKNPYCMYSVIGVTSFGPIACGNGSRPGVYTRISNYIPWIEGLVWPSSL